MNKSLLEFVENRGITIFDDITKDFDLRDYINDSIDFIDFIVELEEYYNIKFPDELLNLEVLGSFEGLRNLLDELVEKTANNSVA